QSASHVLNELESAFPSGPRLIGQRHHADIEIQHPIDLALFGPGAIVDPNTRNVPARASHVDNAQAKFRSHVAQNRPEHAQMRSGRSRPDPSDHEFFRTNWRSLAIAG